MQSTPIPFGKPLLDDAEIEAVVAVLRGTQFVHGPITKAFEERFAARAGAKHAISVSSCTAGLHLSLFCKGIGSGQRVAVPAMTHVATAHAVEYCGATPVFVDVEPTTGNMDAGLLEQVAADGLDAIEVVHYLGLPCDMDTINRIAQKVGAFVVEDCALAIDATYGEQKAGTFGLTGCFSFYPVKHMTTVEGGMITTNDDDMAIRLRSQRAFGYDRNLGERALPGMYDVNRLGYNYRMSEVEAAVGLAQLDKLDGFQRERAQNYRMIMDGLVELDELTVFAPINGKSRSAHYCLNVVLPRDGRIDRRIAVDCLNAAGIGTSIHYPSAVPLFDYYRKKYGYKAGQFPVAEWLAAQTISLPVGPHLNEGDSHRIVAEVKSAILAARV